MGNTYFSLQNLISEQSSVDVQVMQRSSANIFFSPLPAIFHQIWTILKIHSEKHWGVATYLHIN